MISRRTASVWIVLLVLLGPVGTSAMECKATTIFNLGRVDQEIGLLSASASDEDPYPHRRRATVAVGVFGVRAYAFVDNTAQASAAVETRFAEGELKLDNVVFESATNDPIDVELNLDLDGGMEFSALSDGTWAMGRVAVNVYVNGVHDGGEVELCECGTPDLRTGLLAGTSGRTISERLTTRNVQVPVNQPVEVLIRLQANSTVGDKPRAVSELTFNNTLTFAKSGPVFNVPAGVTVNSENSMIIDNFYAGGSPVETKNQSWGSVKSLFR